MMTNRKVIDLVTAERLVGKRVLDIGAGNGYFSAILKEHLEHQGWNPREILEACDYSPDVYGVPDIRCKKVDLNRFPYPYEDDTFDCICAIEVVEHIENQFEFIRECRRILKPGGKLFVTTPNVLNINSRLRYLFYGFPVLFGPLPMSLGDRQSTCGHVHPVSLYYLVYMMITASFQSVTSHFDRFKQSARFWLLVLLPLLVLGRLHYHLNEIRHDSHIIAENSSWLRTMNGFGIFLSRTIIIMGMK